MIAISLYLIQVGSNGLALAPRKAVFLSPQGEKLNKEPEYYLKGVTNPKKVKMDFSKVKINKVGLYKVYVKQSNRNYEFSIQITK